MPAGIYVRTKYFCELIFNHMKTIETRNGFTLDPFIGQRVGIIRTGCGKPTLLGYATITDRCIMGRTAFEKARPLHHVKPGSRYDIGDRPYKVGYYLEDIERLETPVTLNPVKGNRIWREIEL